MTQFFDQFLHFDLSVFEWIQTIQNEALSTVMKFYTTLGEGGIIFILIALALLITKKYRKVGFAMVCGLVVMVIGNDLILKNLFARPRPFDLDPSTYAWWFEKYTYPEIVARPDSFSFPSGHTSSAFAAAFAALAYNKKFGFMTLILAIAMGFSRIYCEVHYCSDVIAGVIVGVVYALIAIIIVKLVFPIFEKVLNSVIEKIKPKKKLEK